MFKECFAWYQFPVPWEKRKRQYHEGDLYPGGRAFHWRLGLWRPPRCGARLSVTVGRPPLRTDFDQSRQPSFCRTKTAEMKKKTLVTYVFNFTDHLEKGRKAGCLYFSINEFCLKWRDSEKMKQNITNDILSYILFAIW